MSDQPKIKTTNILRPVRHFVTIEAREGMLVSTPNGRGRIEAVGDDYVVVNGAMWKSLDVQVLDAGIVVNLGGSSDDDE